ncbi:MAG: sulfurtransferase [Armatimonadota bacterium]|nr:MAG: sulfurtransferase [Armatimonadota bacterium]
MAGAVLAALATAGGGAPAAQRIVSTEWLYRNLTRGDIRIIDIRDKIADYWQGHIPGAVYYAPDAMRLADHGVPGMLMPPQALAIMLGRMGVGNDTMVIVYTERGDYKAPYLIWALDYLGHARAAVLEGGFQKWQDEGHAVTQDYPQIRAAGFTIRLHPEVRATLAEVRQVVNRGGAVLLDVRPTDLYTGEKGLWKRKGHIRGAVNHFWGDDLDTDSTWKSRAELQATYEKLDATPDKLIIVSCGQGQMSAHSYFTLKYVLGYPNVKNYDGSFNEWSNISELPVTTGASPK